MAVTDNTRLGKTTVDSAANDEMFTTAVRAGEATGEYQGALATPIFRSAVFGFPDTKSASDVHEGRTPGYFYGRMGNPTQTALEQAMCALENGEAALATSSGMSAISSLLLSLLKPGDHVLAPQTLYASTQKFLTNVLAPIGVEIELIDGTNIDSWEKSIRANTRVLYAESPSNPKLSIMDLSEIARIADAHRVISIVDNTFATPFNQSPIDQGIKVVVHSATKYLGGHGDLVAGVIVGPNDVIHQVRWHSLKLLGGVISPDVASLVLRGIKTLPLRMQQHNFNGLKVAEFLSCHSKITKVHYPGLPSHPQHELAAKQMRGFGGMVAFEVGDAETARQFLNRLKFCKLAVSLGDVTTLIQHSVSMTHASVPSQQRRLAGIGDGLIRLSTGIERVQDIIEDLKQALDKL